MVLLEVKTLDLLQRRRVKKIFSPQRHRDTE